jgi:hypothetical protein
MASHMPTARGWQITRPVKSSSRIESALVVTVATLATIAPSPDSGASPREEAEETKQARDEADIDQDHGHVPGLMPKTQRRDPSGLRQTVTPPSGGAKGRASL